MSKSLISNEKVCFICGTPLRLHQHHIFEGIANRRLSDEDGCWVWLCGEHHNLSNKGVHYNTPFEITLKKYCQHIWEEKNGSRDDFRKRYGKSWL